LDLFSPWLIPSHFSSRFLARYSLTGAIDIFNQKGNLNMLQEDVIDSYLYLNALELLLAQELSEEFLPDALVIEAECLSRSSFDLTH
jgi:hypothetical protein